LKIGDSVQVVGIPAGLRDETKSLFELCIGRVFPIVGMVPVAETGGELLELHVGEIKGEAPYIHSIWIENEFVRPTEP
jgi:hypothetical protein